MIDHRLWSRALTCVGRGGSTDGHHVRAVLCDGLDGQLVLAQRGLLHQGDRLEGGGLGGLNDATCPTYRGA